MAQEIFFANLEKQCWHHHVLKFPCSEGRCRHSRGDHDPRHVLRHPRRLQRHREGMSPLPTRTRYPGRSAAFHVDPSPVIPVSSERPPRRRFRVVGLDEILIFEPPPERGGARREQRRKGGRARRRRSRPTMLAGQVRHLVRRLRGLFSVRSREELFPAFAARPRRERRSFSTRNARRANACPRNAGANGDAP